jgi:cystathionine beta-synthase
LSHDTHIDAKCEFLNPGGSVKDRIGYRMVLDAEAKGILKPGSTVIEPTSGNTGIGLAMACAIRKYRCIIVLPEKNSDEKVNVLKALGAEIIRTRTEAKFDEPDSLVAVAQRLQKEIPDSVILNQYTNSGNPLAHYDGTGSEILHQLDGKVDMVVMGAGTGGTVTGVGRRVKETCPDCFIVAVDPEGSILAVPESLNDTSVVVYEVEGIGYDFIPTVLDRSVVDKWIKSNDKMAFPMAKRLIREEGFLCGGSSGAAMAAAMEVAKDLREDQRCVVLCPDNIRNYMTKFLVDNWMEARDFKEPVNSSCHPWWNDPVANLIQSEVPLTITETASCQEVFDKLKSLNLDQIAITDVHGSIQGMATITNIMSKILDLSLKFTDPISKGLYKKFIKIKIDTSIGRLSRILEKEPYVVAVQNREICEFTFVLFENNFIVYLFSDENKETRVVESVLAVLTQKNLLSFIESKTCKAKISNGH